MRSDLQIRGQILIETFSIRFTSWNRLNDNV